MIKFFRKIRQNLLSENPPAGTARLQDNVGQGRTGKFSKYILYAFGEVVLVMIGILLTLFDNPRKSGLETSIDWKWGVKVRQMI
jgi:hypothetical protein